MTVFRSWVCPYGRANVVYNRSTVSSHPARSRFQKISRKGRHRSTSRAQESRVLQLIAARRSRHRGRGHQIWRFVLLVHSKTAASVRHPQPRRLLFGLSTTSSVRRKPPRCNFPRAALAFVRFLSISVESRFGTACFSTD